MTPHSGSPADPEVQHVFDDIKLGKAIPDRSVADCEAVTTRSSESGHRRCRAHLLTGRSAGHVPPRQVQRAHPASPDVSAHDHAVADRPVRRASRERPHRSDHLAPLFNPLTYLGMVRLGGIVARCSPGAICPAAALIPPAQQASKPEIVSGSSRREQRIHQRSKRAGKQQRCGDLKGRVPKNTAGASVK